MDEVDIEDLTIEQYLRLTHKSQTPKKIEDMTITEYLEYEKKVNENHISNTKSYLPTYFGKSAESNCDSEDMEEEVEYMTGDEVVISEQEESNHGYTLNIKHLEGKDDVDKWLNAEITKHMNMHGVENMKDALISIIKSIRQEMKDDIMKRKFEALTTSVSDEVSSIASNEVDNADNNTLNTAPCRLHKELIPGSFLLPFNINNHNLYDTTTLNAKDNIMPQRVYESFGLDKLGGTSTLENTTGTNEPLGTINILTILESTRAQIDVFNEEISFEIDSKKFKFNIDTYQSIKKIYMVSIGQEEETFNPLEIGIDLFSYESHACLQFEQRTRSYGTTKPQDEIAGPDSLSLDRRGLVKKWHSLGVKEQGTLRQRICFRDHERRAVKGSYMGFANFLQVCYEQQKIDDTTWEQRNYDWVSQNYEFSKHQTLTSTTLNDHYPYDPIPTPQGHQEPGEKNPQPIRPRPCNYSFEEWMKIRIGHDNLHEHDRQFIFNEWILDSYDVKEEYAREIGNPYSRRFDEYNRVFNNEIEHLSNEYILRIGKKGYVPDDVWEKCHKNYKKTNESWHDEGYEEDEMWQSGDKKTDYDPSYDEALPLGRVNGARFKSMIRKELEGNKLCGYVFWKNSQPSGLKGLLHMLNATVIPKKGIKSLREDEDNLKDFRQISNLDAMLREFLVLILLFPFFHYLNVQ
ncbi:hypothetical protein Tco_0951993 [Tanacetum coccineum]|uniref:Uncharacterized protein n=1 Tax=Tanacetum coccineum TaxID=301880 RepID=A0ABQ5DXK6_9ASTR